jgi:hypothetical protein
MKTSGVSAAPRGGVGAWGMAARGAGGGAWGVAILPREVEHEVWWPGLGRWSMERGGLAAGGLGAWGVSSPAVGDVGAWGVLPRPREVWIHEACCPGRGRCGSMRRVAPAAGG